ncbi:MAG: AAA family ATPase [Chloroflexi bacterium]|nr:AAA family ATPase [Chloroflexota bacterium]
MAIPHLWLFAGPNGAGKTTFTQLPQWSGHIRHFLNADELTRQLLNQQGFRTYASTPADILQRANVSAAENVFSEVCRLLNSGEAVAVETVLSTDKYRPVVEKLRREHGIFNLVYIGLRSPELSRERVARRVAQGGHPVPEEKLAGRWRRSLEHLPWFASGADHFYIYDNSDSDPDQKPALVAREGPKPGSLLLLDRKANPPLAESLLASSLFSAVLGT